MVKLGVGDSYDKTVIDQKVRAYFDLTKPASSVGIMLAIPFAAILYGELYYGSGATYMFDNWRTVIFAATTMFLLHGGAQTLNMAEDAEMDMASEHKQNRPIPAGIVTEEEARSIAWILIMAGVTRAFITNASFGLYAVVLAFFGIFYNLSPLRMKKRLWLNIVWQAVSRGLLLYPAAFAAFGKPLSPIALGMGICAFLLVLSMQQTADFSDVEMDEKHGIITPAVHYGLEKLVYIMTGIVLLMFSVLTLFIEYSVVPNFWSLYLLFIPIGWSLWSLYTEPGETNDLSDNHSSWYVYYGCLASMYMLPAVQLTLF